MKKLRKSIGLNVSVCLCLALTARANVVSDWNVITIQTISASVPPRPPGGSSFLDIAMVQLAVHNAVAAFDGQFRPYYRAIPEAAGSPVAAVAKAAHDVLVTRFPAQTASLDTTYSNYLAAKLLSPSDPGVSVGQRAAADIIALRANDGSFPSPEPPPFIGGTGMGIWRPTPPAFAPMATPWLGNVKPFALTSPAQFLAKPPPALNSGLYARDYNEVKELGSLTNSKRTSQQTELAYFWASNYLVVWNQVLRDLATAQALNIGQSARLFALANMAMADAAITSWNTKNRYVFWRPITAVQNGDNDGNRNTVGDPAWQPLIATPPYPDHSSGANNVTGAVTRILHRFFGGNEMTFSVTTTNPLAMPKTRTYRQLSDAAEEVVDARVYEGIHFRFADTDGRSQGESVAKWTFKHFLQSVNDDDNQGDDDDR